MTSTPKWQAIRISLVLSLHFSVRLKKVLWMPMPGFIPWNRGSPFLLYHVRTQVKLTLPLSNFVVPPVFGGITIVPCNLMAMLSPRRNFGMPSAHTIYPKG
jgi:hypothetical protein